MDKEREERQGNYLPKSEEDQQDEQADDTQGHFIKGHRQDEGDDEEKQRGEAERFRGA